MKSNDWLSFLRWTLFLTVLLLFGALYQAFSLARALQVSAASVKWMALLGGLGLAGLAALAGLGVSWTRWKEGMLAGVARAGRWLGRLRPLHWPLFALLAVVFPLVVLRGWPAPLDALLGSFFWRAALFWLLALGGAGVLYARRPAQGWARALGSSALILAAVYRAAAFLPDISTYPFSLTWSEGSRYFYASLFFAERVYGQAARPTVLHPTRYMMQAVPFLLGGLPLWFHRAWQVGLWLGTNALAAWLVGRRVGNWRSGIVTPASPLAALAFVWAFLFLFQGPVWYHLVVMIVLVLWGQDSERFWKTLGVVVLASVWAGMSRVNWIPFPAALAALLYLLERKQGGTPLRRYLLPPTVWGVAGVAAGLLSQAAYALLSGNSLDQFGSSFTSDLLWYRLFPSATYPLGVLPGILLASLPVFWVAAERLRGRWGGLSPVRWLGVGAVLLVFFAGGLVVSVKIGGGSNLHNMDGYLALLMVAGAYVFFGRVKLEGEEAGGAAALGGVPRAALALAVAVPVGFAISVGGPRALPDRQDAQAELATLVETVEQAAAQGGEVLFISQRQLLTFGMVEGVPLVEEYEKVFLMEMAMAGNPNYLGRFREDLENRRFALIVTDPVRVNLQSRADEFGEENNAWDRHVSVPLLCYYEEQTLLQAARVQVLSPREVAQCPSQTGQ